MNFDVGEVLRRAWQISWKHKVLWVFNMFPVFTGFLFLLIVFIPMFFLGPNSLVRQGFVDRSSYTPLFIYTDIFLILLSVLLYALGAASASLGVLRIESGKDPLKFQELFQDGLKYYWRFLGVTVLIGAGISAVFFLLFGCLLLLRTANMGWGLVCLQPLLVLLYPAFLIVYALTEEAQAALVVENVNVVESVVRSWSLVKNNFWRFVLISILLYFGIFILSCIVTLPLLAPFFFLPLLEEDPSLNFDVQSLGGTILLLNLVLLPILALVQGFLLTFMKSVYMIVYLRLTRPAVLQPGVRATTP